MKPEFNVLVLFANGTPTGADRQSALDRVRDWYAPAVKLNISAKDYDVAFPVWDAQVQIPLNQGGYGPARFLNEAWYDNKVTSYAIKLGNIRQKPYHAVVLVLSSDDWKGMRVQGKFGDCSQGVGQLYINGSPMMYSNLYINLKHELGHFLDKFLGLGIDIHKYISDQNSGDLSPELLPLLKVTPFYAWWRGVMYGARIKVTKLLGL